MGGSGVAAVLELRSVSKHYGPVVAVDAIDLRIAADTYCCLLGPSGCGKTSTLRMIAGHETVTSGEIVFDGEPITDRPPGRRGTAMMFQSYALFPHLSVIDNVAFALKMRGIVRERRRARAAALLELMAMEAYAGRFPAQLSGGQRQRVSLMRALMLGPELLFLDEPLGALDPMIRAELRTDLREIFRVLGQTVVLVTHDLVEAEFFADRVVLLRDGDVVQQGPLRDLVEHPAEPFVTRFIHAQSRPGAVR